MKELVIKTEGMTPAEIKETATAMEYHIEGLTHNMTTQDGEMHFMLVFGEWGTVENDIYKMVANFGRRYGKVKNAYIIEG